MINLKKLRNPFLLLILLFTGFTVKAQTDSIFIQAKLEEDMRTLHVTQKMVVKNRSLKQTDEIILLNWVAAYKKRNSDLYRRKIEDRSRDLHFAKEEELGKLESLQITGPKIAGGELPPLSSENISLLLTKPLQPGEATAAELRYTLRLPLAKFTGYGNSEKGVALKYFFLVPDSFPDRKPGLKTYHDTEETSTSDIFWKIELKSSKNLFAVSNLKEVAFLQFEGILFQDPEIFLSEKKLSSLSTTVDGRQVQIQFNFKQSEEELRNLEFFLPLQLKFIKERTGFLPEKIYISEKFKKKEDFFGNNDIQIWKFKFPLFTSAENVDMDYFSIISKNVLEQSITVYKQEDHWFTNGLKSYLEYQYLKKNYANSKLLGMLPETKIFGIKPLKLFYAARMKLTERYRIAYQHMMTQNLDQKIKEDFTELSNFNEMAISNFETGMLFNYIAEKTGERKFEDILSDYLAQYRSTPINTDHFLQKLSDQTSGDTEFLKTLIRRKHRINFDLNRFKKQNGKFAVQVKKDGDESVPFKLNTISEEGLSTSYWYDTAKGNSSAFFEIPENNTVKLDLNSGGIFPESNFRDNYLYTTGLFANTKKIRFKLIKDIPNPEYNEIYVNPRLDFNAYDNVLAGINFKNESLFDQKFSYSLTPYFSTGTGKITGSGSVSYSFLPPESFYRNLTVGISGSYFHYDHHLSYRKFSGFANMNFRKRPRSTIGRSVGISYNHYEKDLTPLMIAENEYDRYNLWSLGYGYSDSRLIHEKYFSANMQGMEDFQKISAEAFYRYEFAPNKKIAFRLFTGYFLNNRTRNDIFDYGISRISNYSFSYGLLGQSATSGILAQQFVLADGGFKSYIDSTVNQWITSFNMDSHVWKMFNVYADAGLYKNKGQQPNFIWDSGVKVRIIPDFLEVYLPVYSTLGFEPSFKDYAKRIRYTLVLNLSAVVNTLRRGWY